MLLVQSDAEEELRSMSHHEHQRSISIPNGGVVVARGEDLAMLGRIDEDIATIRNLLGPDPISYTDRHHE